MRPSECKESETTLNIFGHLRWLDYICSSDFIIIVRIKLVSWCLWPALYLFSLQFASYQAENGFVLCWRSDLNALSSDVTHVFSVQCEMVISFCFTFLCQLGSAEERKKVEETLQKYTALDSSAASYCELSIQLKGRTNPRRRAIPTPIRPRPHWELTKAWALWRRDSLSGQRAGHIILYYL